MIYSIISSAQICTQISDISIIDRVMAIFIILSINSSTHQIHSSMKWVPAIVVAIGLDQKAAGSDRSDSTAEEGSRYSFVEMTDP